MVCSLHSCKVRGLKGRMWYWLICAYFEGSHIIIVFCCRLLGARYFMTKRPTFTHLHYKVEHGSRASSVLPSDEHGAEEGQQQALQLFIEQILRENVVMQIHSLCPNQSLTQYSHNCIHQYRFPAIFDTLYLFIIAHQPTYQQPKGPSVFTSFSATFCHL